MNLGCIGAKQRPFETIWRCPFCKVFNQFHLFSIFITSFTSNLNQASIEAGADDLKHTEAVCEIFPDSSPLWVLKFYLLSPWFTILVACWIERVIVSSLVYQVIISDIFVSSGNLKVEWWFTFQFHIICFFISCVRWLIFWNWKFASHNRRADISKLTPDAKRSWFLFSSDCPIN